MIPSVSFNPSGVLSFRRPLTRLTKCSLAITNNDQQPIAFIAETTDPKLFCVRPDRGRIEPGQSIDILVQMQALKFELPLSTEFEDKLLVKCISITSEKENLTSYEIWSNPETEDENVFQQSFGVIILEHKADHATVTEEGPSIQPSEPYTLPRDANASFLRALGTSGDPEGSVHISTNDSVESSHNDPVSLFPTEILFRRPLTIFLRFLLTIRNVDKEHQPVAFKIKITAPKLYFVQPNMGIIEPGESIDIWVTKQAHQVEPPRNTECKDKFLVEAKIITSDMRNMSVPEIWDKESKVFHKKLRVHFLPADGQTNDDNEEEARESLVSFPPSISTEHISTVDTTSSESSSQHSEETITPPDQSLSTNVNAPKPEPFIHTSSQETLQGKDQCMPSPSLGVVRKELLSFSPEHNLSFKRPLTTISKHLLTITNKNENLPVAFKVKTTAPKLYCVKPNSGRLRPGQSVDVSIVLQAFRTEPPLDMKCKDKFLILGTVITPNKHYMMLEDIWRSPDMNEEGKIVHHKLGVIYLPAEQDMEDKLRRIHPSYLRIKKWVLETTQSRS
ncbi:PapD-like protein [Pholiota conissans]|uniref:PapD-like protein n=1 Tax=Pholiota conissans TaxID=109636 RepID=A0A9P5YYV7_9AGAR|nr:PapD-like protein [Pholiota conissans]